MPQDLVSWLVHGESELLLQQVPDVLRLTTALLHFSASGMSEQTTLTHVTEVFKRWPKLEAFKLIGNLEGG